MRSFNNWLVLRENEEQQFIDAINQNPSDNHLWLVYADWLEERGEQQRAARIRKAHQAGVPAPRVRRSAFTYGTYPAWKRAVIQLYPAAKFHGDKDIDSASWGNLPIGEWDGAWGQIYARP